LSAGNAGPPVYIDLRYENGFAMRWALPEPAAPDGNREPGIGNQGGVTAAKPNSLDELPMPLLASLQSPLPNPNSWLLQ
ncbi:MAG: hypothetical protein WAR01_11280, partial [Dokdonella sp.]